MRSLLALEVPICLQVGCSFNQATEQYKNVRAFRPVASPIAFLYRFLEHAGLDEYALFPDIVGMARHLRRVIFEASS